jgi:hypothetical protein
MEQSTLFKTTKELSRNEKLRKSKKVTADLTQWAIDYLNDSNQFLVHRSNNTPSTRIVKTPKIFKAFDKDGNPITFEYDEVEIFFKKGNIKKTILDISGFCLDGKATHIELEVKTGKDSLSEGQIKRIEDIKSAGGISFAFKDKESFLWQIKPFVRERKQAF